MVNRGNTTGQIVARALMCVGLLVASSGFADKATAADRWDAAGRLQAQYPGLEWTVLGDSVAFYGKPMNAAESPEAAAAAWVEAHRAAFGVRDLQLTLVASYDVGFGEKTVFWYEQVVGETPVEFGNVRIVALNRASDSVIVYAAATLANVTEESLAPIVIDAATASERVERHLLFRRLDKFSAPELSIVRTVPGAEVPTPRRTWRLVGQTDIVDRQEAYTFHIDANTGELLEARSEIYHVDVEGTLNALATPGDLPDTASNPPVITPVGSAEVGIGASIVLTGEDGSFLVPFGGAGPIGVDANLVSPWTEVVNQAGPVIDASETVTPPGPADLLLNPTPSELTTAQVNAFIHVNQTHDFFKERAPSFTGLDIQIDCNVNINDSCNATFNGANLSVNFFTSGSGCTNSAFSDVIQHEYGHYIVNRLGLAQGAFGEGYGDIMSIVFADDPLLAEGFFGPGTVGRDIAGANVQYPCPGTQVHFCGQIVAGVFWDLRVELAATSGIAMAREITQQLLVDWSLMTLGGQGSNSAHPMTAIEYLVADDDDGDFANGTPHALEICEAFASHSIDCPPLPPLAFEFPVPFPSIVAPGEAVTVTVGIRNLTGNRVPGSERLWYDDGTGQFVETVLTAIPGGDFEGVLPGRDCGRHRFFFTADVVGGGTESSTTGVDHTIPVGDGFVELLYDDAETDAGWTVGDPTDTATTGIWVRVNPIGTGAQPEDDNTVAGTQCWVTGQGTPGGSLGENDIDGGVTTLTSPTFDATQGETRVEFYVWYSNTAGAQPASDVFLIEASDAGGAPGSWVTIRQIGPDVGNIGGGWFRYEFWVTDYLDATSTVAVRFRAADDAPGSLVEAAVDDFRVETVFCEPVDQFIRGDCNQDLDVQVSDVVFLLPALFGGGATPPCTDACDNNDDGTLDISDAVYLLEHLFASGAALPDPSVDCGADPTDGDALDCADGICP